MQFGVHLSQGILLNNIILRALTLIIPVLVASINESYQLLYEYLLGRQTTTTVLIFSGAALAGKGGDFRNT